MKKDILALSNTSSVAIHLTEKTLLPILSKVLQISLVLHFIAKGIKGVIKFVRLLGRPPDLTIKPGDGSATKTG